MKKHSFIVQPTINVGRSKFDLSHKVATTFTSGKLIPLEAIEVLPGDTFNFGVDNVTRMLTPAVPVMDNCVLDIFHYWVPFRLCTKGVDDWQRICGENVDGKWAANDESTLTSTGNTFSGYSENENGEQIQGFEDNTVDVDSPAAYLGWPVGNYYQNALPLNTLSLRAYMKIWNEYFRDQNLQDPLEFDGTNGTNNFMVYYAGDTCLPVCKLHDRFTSCLPAPQKGASVGLFAGSGTVPVMATNSMHSMGDYLRFKSTGMTIGENFHYEPQITADGSGLVGAIQSVSGATTITPSNAINQSNLVANLELATATTINDLRNRFAIQRMLEKDARHGTRFREIMLGHFGVRVPDLTVQVPEYLGGVSKMLNIDTVLQTSETSSTPLGTTGAYSMTGVSDSGFIKSFTEAGLIMTLCCVRPMQTYSQGVPKFLLKNRRFDFYWNVFANLGEQPVMAKELAVFSAADINSDRVFGYNEAWSDNRFLTNRVSGHLHANSGDNTMTSWTYTNKFSAMPYLNAEFIKQPSLQIGRTLVDTTTQTQFVADFYFKIKAVRELPLYSIPGLLDHN